MKKLIISICSVLCLCILSTYCVAGEPLKAEPTSEVSLTAKAGVLVDYASGEVLLEHNADDQLPIASMVKLMTLLLSFEEIDSGNMTYDTMITTTENASGMGGSQVFIDPYVSYSARQLIQSVIMASANDASVALAEHISGSEESFVKKMNARASELGMTNTLYANCTGLPEPNQYSSAKDCAIVLKELMKHEGYFKSSTVWMDELTHPSGRKTELVNTNKLIRYYKGCDAGKTGSTSEAGYCLTASCRREDMRLIAVVIGAKDGTARFNETAKLFTYGFANFENKTIVDENVALSNLEVRKSKVTNADLYAERSFVGLCKKGEKANFETNLVLPEKLVAPIKAGDEVGKVIVSKNGAVVDEISLIVKEDIPRLSYFDSVKKIIGNF